MLRRPRLASPERLVGAIEIDQRLLQTMVRGFGDKRELCLQGGELGCLSVVADRAAAPAKHSALIQPKIVDQPAYAGCTPKQNFLFRCRV